MKDEDLSREELLTKVAALRRRIEELEFQATSSSKAGLHDSEGLLEKNSDQKDAVYQMSPCQAPGVQEDYRSVVQSASEAICITQDGLIKLANRAGTELTGYSQEELVSMVFAALVHPDDLEELVRIYMMRLRAEYVAPGHRFRIITKPGAVKWVESWSASITWSGRPAVLSMIRDVNSQVQEEERLRVAHEELDRRVRERTEELQARNEDLMLEIDARRRVEDKLRSSEERFRTLIETMNDAFGIQDEDGFITYVNSKQCEMLGYSREELIGRRFADFFDQDSRQTLLAELDRRREGEPGSYEVTFVRKGGDTVDAIISGCPVFDQMGTFKGSFGVATDITGRKKVEEALRESEERYRRIVETANEGIWVVDSGFRTTFVNQRMADMLGYSTEEMVGRTADSFMFEKELPDHRAQVDMRRRGISSVYERHYVRKDGSALWALVSASPLKNAAGGSVGSFAMLTDVTERKNAEEALKKSEERYRRIVQTAHEGIWAMDGKSRTTFVNQRMAEMLGYSEEEMLGRTVDSFMFQEDLVDHEEKMERRRQGRDQVYERRFRCKDGTELWTAVSATALQDADECFAGSFAMFTDITERKRAEEALRTSEERLRLALEATQDGLWDWDMTTDEVFRSPAFLSMLGYEPNELPGRVGDWQDRLDPEERLLVKDALSEYLSGKRKSHRVEFRIFRKPGEVAWILSRGRVVARDASGNPIRMVGTHTDITERKKIEEALRESRQQLETIFQASPAAIFLVNPEGRITLANQRMLELFSLTSDELVGKPYVELVHPEERSIGHSRMKALMVGEIDHVSLERRYLKAQGMEFLGHLSGRRLTHADGSLGGLLGIITDITNQKKAEHALRESEYRYRQLFESMSSGVAIYQPLDGGEDFVFVDFNRAAERIERTDRTQVIGRRVTETFPGVRTFGLLDVFQRVYRTGQSEYFPATIYKDDRDPGTWRENWVHKLPNGQIVAVYDDITERQRAQETLQRERDRAQSYLDSASVMMLALDVNGHLTLVNKKGCEILGYEESDILGKNWLDTFVPERDRERVNQVFRQVVSGELEPVRYHENPILTSSGDERLIAWHNNFVTDPDGTIVGTLGSGEDITDRRRAEQLAGQAERYRAVADLTSGIAHNFNNLLQIVIGNASLGLMNLQSGDLTELKQNLEQIVESARFGAETVNRLNRYARGTGDDQTAAIEVFDLSDLITQATEMSKPWWKTEPEKHGRRVSLFTRLTNGCTIRGKKNEMFEVVVNLIRNSVEALPKGGVIEIETATENNAVFLRVHDTGIGIRQENLNRLFTPFFTTNVESGRGLGLATCRRIVDSHGGTILADSIEGEGTTLTITLPLVLEEPVLREVDESKSPEKALNVLAVDDMEATVRMLKSGLGRFGHTVLTALSGEESLAVFKDNPIDLVICDLGMPEMNGWQVGKGIKEISREKGTPKPAFILLTGWEDQGQETEKITESGVDAIVQKPVEMTKLLEVIRQVTEQ